MWLFLAFGFAAMGHLSRAWRLECRPDEGKYRRLAFLCECWSIAGFLACGVAAVGEALKAALGG